MFEPDLPVGLTFDTQTALISGTSLIPLSSTPETDEPFHAQTSG